MRPRLSSSRLALGTALVTFGVFAALSGEARADWTNVRERDVVNPRHREPFCMFFSGPSCVTSLSLDGVGAYQRSWSSFPVDKDYGRLAAEIGFLVKLGRLSTHAGLAFEAGGAVNDDDAGWHLIPKLRFRFWPGYSIVGIELSPGFVYEAHDRKNSEEHVERMGAHGELGVTFLGAFTLYAGGEWLTQRGDSAFENPIGSGTLNLSPSGTQSANFIAGGRLLLPVFLEILAHWH